MKKLSFKKAVIIEAAVLAVLLVVFWLFLFPLMTKGMMHVVISTHIFAIGLMALIFGAFAITVKKAWKTHGKYMLMLIIFTVFGFLMQCLANEVGIFY